MLKPVSLSEADVSREIIEYAKHDSRIAEFKRINSGVMKTKQFTRSVRHIKQGDLHDIDAMKTCDFEGQLIDGRRLIVEAKAGDWTLPKSDDYLADALRLKQIRDEKTKLEKKKAKETEKERVFWQKVAIDNCRKYNGVAGFVRSIDELDKLLSGDL